MRSRARLAAAALTAMLLCAPPGALAQTLNLDAPSAPRPGDGRASLALIQRMTDDLDRLRAGDTGGAARDESRLDRRTRLAIQTRRLIRNLARRGEMLGEAGSTHLLAARTLAAAIADLESLAGRAADARDPALDLAIAQFIASPRGAAPDADAGAAEIPADPDELDRFLRDRFVMLLECLPPPQHGHTGWIAAEPGPDNPEPLTASIDRWAAAGRLSPDAADTLRRFDAETLAPALTLRAFAPSAAGLIASIQRTGNALDHLPAWTPEDLRAELNARFGGAAAKAIDRGDGRAVAAIALDSLRLACDTMGRMDRLIGSSAAPIDKPIAAARDALLRTVTAAAGAAPGSTDREALEAFDRALALLDERSSLGAEADVARDVRPAWRAMDQAAKRTEADLWAALPRLGPAATSDPGGLGPMSDPAIVGPMAAHRRSLDELAALRTISRAVWESGALTEPQRRLIASRILRLGQDLGGQPAAREAAQAQLRRLGADLDALLELPGERDLRAAAGGGPGAAAWTTLAGDKHRELIAAIDAARAQWLDSLGAPPTAAALGAADASAPVVRLRALHTLLRSLRDTVTVSEMTMRAASPGTEDGRRDGIQSWPGWELSPRALAALTSSAAESLTRATAAAIDGDVAAAARILRSLESARTIRLTAALDAAARGRNFRSDSPLYEVAGPPPIGAWLADSRADLAAICRYLEEYADAIDNKEPRRASRLMAYIDTRADAVLRREPSLRATTSGR